MELIAYLCIMIKGSGQFPGLKCGTYEYNKISHACKKFNISYDEYLKCPEKYNLSKIKHTKYKRGTKEYNRVLQLKYLYGIEEQDFLNLIEAQNMICPICDEAFSDLKNTCLDHCHSTNKVRGVLCRKCNMALGIFKDDINILQNAINYIKTNG